MVRIKTLSFRQIARSAFALATLMATVVVADRARADIPLTEGAVLLDIYTSTNGAGWNNSAGWNGAPGSECRWYGVGCGGPGGNSVVSIGLPGNNLVGPLPALTGLPALQQLSVSGNKLTGNIPNLSSLTSMTSISVWSNQMTGSISWMSSLTALTFVDASNNKFSGNLPDVSALSALRHFDVSANQLTGTMPPSLSGLTVLDRYLVRQNLLTGGIPQISGLPDLYSFDAGNNGLTGALPPLTGLPKLQIFSAKNNQLTGSIPAIDALPVLFSLDVSNNRLSGSIPSLSGLVTLRNFGVSNNTLTGNIPSLNGLTALSGFYANNNQLTGPLPSLSGLSALIVLNVSSNQLSGALPPVPVPSSLSPNGSRLCPNNFSYSPSAEWDTASQLKPWSNGCASIPAVNASASMHGSIAPLGVQRFNLGDTPTFTVTPEAGYSALMLGTCGGSPAGSTFTLYPLTASCTVVANFYPTGVLPPGAPTIVDVVPGNASLNVSFLPPASDGGGVILDYTATCQGTGAGATTISLTGMGSPILVSGLVNGVQHRCLVAARNAAGSSASAYVGFFTPSVAVAPLPAAVLVLQALPGDGQVTLSFLPPTPPDASITGYLATCEQTDATVTPSQRITRTASGAVSPIIVTGLLNRVQAFCKV